MKLTIMKPTEITATHIRIVAPDYYGGEDMPLDFPMRRKVKKSDPDRFQGGDCCGVWDVVIDIDTGIIAGWPKMGKKSELHLKVTDSGHYELLDGKKLLSSVDDYVPSCVPGEYGDYIIMTIDGEGRIENWNRHCNADSVLSSLSLV